MAWTTKCDFSLGIIEVIYSGDVTATDLREATAKRISLQKETGILTVLVDCSAAGNLLAGTMDLLELPNNLYIEKKADRKTRLAIVLTKPELAKEALHFFETASLNRGWTVRLFEERQSAIDWLQGKTASG